MKRRERGDRTHEVGGRDPADLESGAVSGSSMSTRTRRGRRGLPETRRQHFLLGVSIPKALPLWRRPTHVKDKLPQTRNHQRGTTWLRRPRAQPGESSKLRPLLCLGAGSPTSLPISFFIPWAVCSVSHSSIHSLIIHHGPKQF